MLKIMQFIKRKLHKEQGSLVIEASFVYPIMFFVLMFLIYMGNMFYLKAKIESVVAQEAITYASRFADPNVEAFSSEIPTTTNGKTVTGELYRYIDVFEFGDFGIADETIKNKLKEKIADTGFFAGMTPNDIEVVSHRVNNYIIYQSYEVDVTYNLKFPIGFIFQNGRTYLKMRVREETPVVDTAEFIRNVDMAIDYAERTKAGEQFSEKMNEVYGKIDEFINGEKRDPNEAVAGGAPAAGGDAELSQTYYDLKAEIESYTGFQGLEAYPAQEEYRRYLKENISNRTDLSNKEKVQLMEDMYNKLSTKQQADFNVINNADVLVAGSDYADWTDPKFKEYGIPPIDWPKNKGLASGYKEVSKDNLPTDLTRIGSLYGTNWGVGTENYSQDERAISYIPNDNAYHEYTFDGGLYIACIDCLDGNTDVAALNQLLVEKGVAKTITQKDFDEMKNKMSEFREDATAQNMRDSRYGYIGKAAEWEVGGKTIASGGAGQLNTPITGKQLEMLGIIKEKKK